MTEALPVSQQHACTLSSAAKSSLYSQQEAPFWLAIISRESSKSGVKRPRIVSVGEILCGSDAASTAAPRGQAIYVIFHDRCLTNSSSRPGRPGAPATSLKSELRVTATHELTCSQLRLEGKTLVKVVQGRGIIASDFVVESLRYGVHLVIVLALRESQELALELGHKGRTLRKANKSRGKLVLLHIEPDGLVVLDLHQLNRPTQDRF